MKTAHQLPKWFPFWKISLISRRRASMTFWWTITVVFFGFGESFSGRTFTALCLKKSIEEIEK